MKILITESQSKIVKLRRHFDYIISEFNEYVERLSPCDYQYENGVYDMFNDALHSTVDYVLGNLFNIRYDDDDSDFFDLQELLNHMIFVSEFENFRREKEIEISNCSK